MDPAPAPGDDGDDGGDPAQPGPGGQPGPGRDDGPEDWLAAATPDPLDPAEWAQMCVGRVEDGQEFPDDDEDFYADPNCAPPPGLDETQVEEIFAQAEADGAEDAAVTARMIAAGACPDGWAHRRGDPPVPGVFAGPAAGFGQGGALDEAAPCTPVAGLADAASGEDRSFAGVNDDELMGLIGTRARLAARQDWELLMAVAEFIRRRPKPGCPLEGPARMPRVWNEHATSELAAQLHLTGCAADELLGLAWDLAVKLPATAAALRDGIIDLDKARVISLRCIPLTAAEAGRAEQILFGSGGVEEMTWGMVRDRIARAVIEVDPEAAIRRRKDAARTRRVEVRAEDSGNAMLAGRELPQAAVLAASQALTARARQLRAAGISGGLDELRVQAYLERLGVLDPLAGIPAPHGGDGGPGRDDGTDGGGSGGDADGEDGEDGPGSADSHDGSCSADDGNDDTGGNDGRGGEDGNDSGDDGPGGGSGGGPGGPPPGPGSPGGTVPGVVPAGFAGNVNMTLPLANLLGLAARPGILHRAGPIDPELARELAAAAARNPRSAWCLTITGPDGRPLAHGCGRPPPRGSLRHHDPPANPNPSGICGTAETSGTSADGGPVRYIPGDGHGPPGTGTVRLDLAAVTGTGAAAAVRELVFTLVPLAGPCDHAHQAGGHDPGTLLRHLTGIVNACCTFPPCRRPAAACDYEHSVAYERGGRTCLCQAGPVCRHNHQDKQSAGWRLEPAGHRGWFRWTTPSGRTYLSRPTQYPD